MLSGTVSGLLGVGCRPVAAGRRGQSRDRPDHGRLRALLRPARAHHDWYVAAGRARAGGRDRASSSALIVAIFQVPGWAVSLAAFVGVSCGSASAGRRPPRRRQYPRHARVRLVRCVRHRRRGRRVLGAIRSIRRAVGRFRPISDPADRRGGGAACDPDGCRLRSVVGLAGWPESSTHVTRWRRDRHRHHLAGLAVAIALVGGTSAYGRRGGIFGTVLAAIVFVLVDHYFDRGQLSDRPARVDRQRAGHRADRDPGWSRRTGGPIGPTSDESRHVRLAATAARQLDRPAAGADHRWSDSARPTSAGAPAPDGGPCLPGRSVRIRWLP